MSSADGNAALSQLVAILNAHNLAYMLVGSYSSNAYGIPRATKDADLVVQTLGDTFGKVRAELGDDFRADSQLQFELVTGTLRHVIEYVPVEFKIELFELSTDPFDVSRFNRRIKFESKILGQTVWFPTAEDVVVQKLRWGRPQDCADAINVLAVQSDSLDWSYITHWTDQHGTTDELNQLLEEL